MPLLKMPIVTDVDMKGFLNVFLSPANKDILATVAIQAPFTRAGVDLQIQNKALKPYVEVNTLSKPDRAKSGVWINGVFVPPA